MTQRRGRLTSCTHERSPSRASEPAPAERRGCLRPGCAVLLLLVLGTCGIWRITLPGQFAAATYRTIKPGATLREVIAASDHYWEVTGSQCSGGIDSFQVFTPGLIPSGSILVRREAASAGDELQFST